MNATSHKWNTAIQAEQESLNTVESILLPLDGTVLSGRAVPVARTLSQLYGATFHVTYVGEQPVDAKDTANLLGFSDEEALGIVFHQCKGEPGRALSQLARKLRQTMIVIATSTGPSSAKNRFGSVTESILATKPQRIVLLAPCADERPWKVRRVLLAHDGTPACNAATGPAAELAQRAGTEVIVLHVAARGEASPRDPGSIPAPFYLDQRHHEWPAWAEEFMNRLIAAGRPPSSIHFELAVSRGQPGSEVAEVARDRDVDLVVMAWHGATEHATEQETSASRVVIWTSGCPVLLVYSKEY